MKALVLSALLMTTVLAGCAGSSGGPATETLTKQPLAANKGGIQGLLIDDRYRPVVAGKLFLTPAGLTATTDTLGQFQFVDLDPGTYTIKVDAAGHEAAPVSVDVLVGQYAELEVAARRIFGEGNLILTAQYSAFVPCAADFVANGIVANCLLDLSGDTYRPGFTTDSRNLGDNVTYLISEAKINQKGNWNIQVRENDGSSSGGERYAVASIKDGTYVKITNQYGVANEEHNGQNNNQPWMNDKPYQTIMFYEGAMKGTLPTCCGAGAAVAIKGTFMQSMFIGTPEVDIAEYHIMAEDQ